MRRAARHVALQTVYCIDIEGGSPEEALEYALSQEAVTEDLKNYITTLVEKVAQESEHLDGLIAPLLAKNWSFSRIAKIDRAILRMAAAELEYVEEMPPKVTINEAVSLAAEYGDKHSSKFVNGVLGKLLPLTKKAKWDPSKFKNFLAADPIPAPVEPEVEMIEAGSPEHEELLKSSGWTLRSE